MTNKQLAAKIDNDGWYSSDRYNSTLALVQMLRRRGYDDRQIEAVIKSKWTRWAADASDKQSGCSAMDLARYMTTNFAGREFSEVRRLTEETFAA